MMRELIFGMNVTLDGYIAATGVDIGWSGPPSDELSGWWLEQERASDLSLYEYALATYPVLVGGGTPFFTALPAPLFTDSRPHWENPAIHG